MNSQDLLLKHLSTQAQNICSTPTQIQNTQTIQDLHHVKCVLYYWHNTDTIYIQYMFWTFAKQDHETPKNKQREPNKSILTRKRINEG